MMIGARTAAWAKSGGPITVDAEWTDGYRWYSSAGAQRRLASSAGISALSENTMIPVVPGNRITTYNSYRYYSFYLDKDGVQVGSRTDLNGDGYVSTVPSNAKWLLINCSTANKMLVSVRDVTRGVDILKNGKIYI